MEKSIDTSRGFNCYRVVAVGIEEYSVTQSNCYTPKDRAVVTQAEIIQSKNRKIVV